MHDWHYFFHHVPHNLDQGIYRIFEPQWKAEILQWFSREDIAKEQKEEFVKALMNFDDGCGNFYRYQAYLQASEALAHFHDCSLGDVIVEQLLKWSYVYFGWQTFPEPLRSSARAALEVTDRERVIAAFVQLLHTTESRLTLRHGALRLGRLDPGNKTAIAALVLLLQVTQDENTLWKICQSLAEISSGDENAIATLSQISYGNETAIAAQVRFLEINQGDRICFDADSALWQINPGNEAAKETLVQILETTEDISLLSRSAEYLMQIDPDKDTVIAAVCKRMETTQNKYICVGAISALKKISLNDNVEGLAKRHKLIAALVRFLQTNWGDNICLQAAETLWQIDPGNEVAIATLVEILEINRNESIRWQAAEILLQTDDHYQKAIATLVEYFPMRDKYKLHELPRLVWLEKISQKNKNENPLLDKAIAIFVRFIQTEEEEEDKVSCLPDNDFYDYESCLLDTADQLKQILQDKHLPQVVTAFKGYLGEFYNSSSYRYEAAYNLIWHCAENMTYQQFYQAWHSLPRTPIQ